MSNNGCVFFILSLGCNTNTYHIYFRHFGRKTGITALRLPPDSREKSKRGRRFFT